MWKSHPPRSDSYCVDSTPLCRHLGSPVLRDLTNAPTNRQQGSRKRTSSHEPSYGAEEPLQGYHFLLDRDLRRRVVPEPFAARQRTRQIQSRALQKIELEVQLLKKLTAEIRTEPSPTYRPTLSAFRESSKITVKGTKPRPAAASKRVRDPRPASTPHSVVFVQLHRPLGTRCTNLALSEGDPGRRRD